MNEKLKAALIQSFDKPDRNGRIYDMKMVQKEIDKFFNQYIDKQRNELLYGDPDYDSYKVTVFTYGLDYGPIILFSPPKIKEIINEYRKFIEENKYRRIRPVTRFNGQISIPGSLSSQSNGSNIKYDSRRLLNGLG